MTRSGLNLLSSIVSLLGALILLCALRTPSGLVWFAASIVWLVMTLLARPDSERLVSPTHRLLRRF